MTTTTTEDKKAEKLSTSLEENPLFKFGPPPIQTFEDAVEQYLRGLISEDELNAAKGKFGHAADHFYISPSRIERHDEAFERELPEDLFQIPEAQHLTVEQRREQAEQKEEVRKAAEEAAKKVQQQAKPEVDLFTLQNMASEEAAHKVEEKQEPVVAEKFEDTKK